MLDLEGLGLVGERAQFHAVRSQIDGRQKQQGALVIGEKRASAVEQKLRGEEDVERIWTDGVYRTVGVEWVEGEGHVRHPDVHLGEELHEERHDKEF